MKKFALLVAAVATFALTAAPVFANSGTNKTQFSVVEAGAFDWTTLGYSGIVPSPAGFEDALASGQVVATRAKKNDPTWYSLSLSAIGVPATEDPNNTPEDPTDDTAIPYCLFDTAGGYPDTVLASGTASATGALKLDYGTAGPLPSQVQVVRCDDVGGTTLLISNSAITAPAPSTK